MKAFLQEIYLNTRWGRNQEPPLIIIFERKYDRAKAQLVRKAYYELIKTRGEKWLSEKISPDQLITFKIYIQMLESPGLEGQIGLMGDFALGWENILGWLKYDEHHTLFSNFGISSMAFPTRRFVFNPTRELNHIAMDSGPETEVVSTFIRYERLDFEDIVKVVNINPNTIYAQIIKTAWDEEKVRDPDELSIEAKRIYDEMLEFLEVENKKPPTSLWGVYNVSKSLKKIRWLKVKGEDLFSHIDNTKINIIDFSQNSDLTESAKNIIFKKVIEWVLKEYVQEKETAVFIAGDEIQNYLRTHWGRNIIAKLFREGRSNQVNFFVATQYLHSLPSEIVYGASHIAILGTLASADDYALLKKVVPDFDIKFERIVAKSPEEVEFLKRKERGKGYFIYNKFFTERIHFRPSQTL
ncbi:hypothetical protein P8X24_11595 [Pyrococcus kukulkanii]|uniref:hypothetical protein n=1 Tax=Pyrococcus kukulkanii TaxID=1609559 RepID=UPI003567A90F